MNMQKGQFQNNTIVDVQLSLVEVSQYTNCHSVLSLTSLSAAYDEAIRSQKLSEKQHIPVAKLVQTILAQHTTFPFTKLHIQYMHHMHVRI